MLSKKSDVTQSRGRSVRRRLRKRKTQRIWRGVVQTPSLGSSRNSLDLFSLYDRKVKEDKRKYIIIKVELTPEFKKTCRERIVEGHKKYGNDWIHKNNLAELELEKYDVYNYEKLDECQREYRRTTRPIPIL